MERGETASLSIRLYAIVDSWGSVDVEYADAIHEGGLGQQKDQAHGQVYREVLGVVATRNQWDKAPDKRVHKFWGHQTMFRAEGGGREGRGLAHVTREPRGLLSLNVTHWCTAVDTIITLEAFSITNSWYFRLSQPANAHNLSWGMFPEACLLLCAYLKYVNPGVPVYIYVYVLTGMCYSNIQYVLTLYVFIFLC